MLRVLLVDDEPFILQGLKILVDWNEEGFEIAGTASDGQEALDFLQSNQVDLIITDIKMPGMGGLELLEKIRNEKLSEAYFVILSGYAEFSYAQRAMQYECSNYMLKPIEKEQLIKILQSVRTMNEDMKRSLQKSQKMERAYLARNMISLILGKFDDANLACIKEHMTFSKSVRYIEIELDEMLLEEELADQEKRYYQRKIFQACNEFLKENADHCFFDVSIHEKIYDIGLVYCDFMAENMGISEKEYLERLHSFCEGQCAAPVVIMVGKRVTDIANIAKSYTTACMLRSIQGFQTKKKIRIYEDDVQVGSSGVILCKRGIDDLVRAIESNHPEEIVRCTDDFFHEMYQMNLSEKIANLNISYLLFQLIHLATEQDDDVNQEEILRLISEGSFQSGGGIMRGSKDHILRFAHAYGDYLTQLRKKVSGGVLTEIEREVQEHYAQNLTLKELGEKYYVNSAYLGQLFRKKYGQSFKDYLNGYRIEQAADRLLRTNEKIYEIAEAVGYHDMDYFVNRFIAAKGCTPAKFRKQAHKAE